MASENETVEDIVKELLGIKGGQHTNGGASYERWRQDASFADGYAYRIKAAHQREVAELRECLREAVTEVCNRLEKCGFKEPCVFKTCYVQKWRKALQDEGGAK